MNKKILLTCGITALTLTVAIAGCGKTNVYTNLNKLAQKEHTSVTLAVTTVTGGETLSGTYEAKSESDGMKVTYQYEKLNPIVTNSDGSFTLPDSYKSTLSGDMVVADGKIVSQNGAAADITVEAITAAGLLFQEDFFTDVTEEEGTFGATVSKPSDFMQTEVTATNMKVRVEYSKDAITSLNITYSTAKSSSVTLTYTFA